LFVNFRTVAKFEPLAYFNVQTQVSFKLFPSRSARAST